MKRIRHWGMALVAVVGTSAHGESLQDVTVTATPLGDTPLQSSQPVSVIRGAALDRYRDSTKQVAVGTASIDYEVGGPAGGPPTVDIVTRFFSPVGLKQFTETLRYAYVDGAGLRLVSMTYEYLGGATLQLTRQ